MTWLTDLYYRAWFRLALALRVTGEDWAHRAAAGSRRAHLRRKGALPC